MTYETPKVEELSPAIAAIQNKPAGIPEAGHDASPSYEDWE